MCSKWHSLHQCLPVRFLFWLVKPELPGDGESCGLPPGSAPQRMLSERSSLQRMAAEAGLRTRTRGDAQVITVSPERVIVGEQITQSPSPQERGLVASFYGS